ncbi:hypothetical protein [Streptomyces klenkii]
MKAFAPEDKVLVSPRHLAGAGLDHLSDAIGPLIHLFGWQTEHNAASGHVALDTPRAACLWTSPPAAPTACGGQSRTTSRSGIEHSVHDGFDTHWSTRFTADDPPEAVTQFFAHLATSAPVEREFREIPFLARDLGDALITPVRGAAVNPHIHHAATRAAPTHTARHR